VKNFHIVSPLFGKNEAFRDRGPLPFNTVDSTKPYDNKSGQDTYILPEGFRDIQWVVTDHCSIVSFFKGSHCSKCVQLQDIVERKHFRGDSGGWVRNGSAVVSHDDAFT